MSERYTLQQQVDEVLCCLLSMQSAVSAYDRASPSEWSKSTRLIGVETGCTRSKLEPLSAAVKTLEWVRDNEDWIRVEAEKRKQSA